VVPLKRHDIEGDRCDRVEKGRSHIATLLAAPALAEFKKYNSRRNKRNVVAAIERLKISAVEAQRFVATRNARPVHCDSIRPRDRTKCLYFCLRNHYSFDTKSGVGMRFFLNLLKTALISDSA
jgi:hypothetical protein